MAITIPQIRGARGLLKWSQGDLAKAAGLAEISLRNIERGVVQPRPRSLKAIEDALAKAGVGFFGQSGVSLKDV